jgi:hypothetical protein
MQYMLEIYFKLDLSKMQAKNNLYYWWTCMTLFYRKSKKRRNLGTSSFKWLRSVCVYPKSIRFAYVVVMLNDCTDTGNNVTLILWLNFILHACSCIVLCLQSLRKVVSTISNAMSSTYVHYRANVWANLFCLVQNSTGKK